MMPRYAILCATAIGAIVHSHGHTIPPLAQSVPTLVQKRLAGGVPISQLIQDEGHHNEFRLNTLEPPNVQITESPNIRAAPHPNISASHSIPQFHPEMRAHELEAMAFAHHAHTGSEPKAISNSIQATLLEIAAGDLELDEPLDQLKKQVSAIRGASPTQAHAPQSDEGGDDMTAEIAIGSAAGGLLAVGVGFGANHIANRRRKESETAEVDLEAEKYILEWSSKNVMGAATNPGTARRIVPKPDPSEFEPVGHPRRAKTKAPIAQQTFLHHSGPMTNSAIFGVEARDQIPPEGANDFEVGGSSFWMEN